MGCIEIFLTYGSFCFIGPQFVCASIPTFYLSQVIARGKVCSGVCVCRGGGVRGTVYVGCREVGRIGNLRLNHIF